MVGPAVVALAAAPAAGEEAGLAQPIEWFWRQYLRLPGCGTPNSRIVERSAQDDAFPNGSAAHLD